MRDYDKVTKHYGATKQKIKTLMEPEQAKRALAAMGRCPRRPGELPPLGSYYCECPACDPENWGLNDE